MNSKSSKIWLAVLMSVSIVVLLVLAYQYHINAPLKGLKIHLNDEEVYSFLQKEDIERLFIDEKNIDITTLSIKNADLNALEQIVLSHPWVANANLYIDNGRNLNIDVTQRIPVARVYEKDHNTYYIDSTLSLMPAVVGYSYPVVVFTDVPSYKDTTRLNVLLNKIVYIANYVAKDTFWSKQIVQFSMDDKERFSFYTLLGDQKVFLGDTLNLDLKLNNLFAFYKQVSNEIGWDKYTDININYINQVVAYPSLGWIPPKPVDTVVVLPNNMKETELLESLPQRPMEDAKPIKKDASIGPKDIQKVNVEKKLNDTVPTSKDSTKIV
jgi:cell division protein FtsQ